VESSVTVDASVFINAFNPEEDGSDQSMAFLAQLENNGVPLIQPTLFFPEVVASIARKQADTETAVALRFGTELVTLDREQLERLPKVLSVRVL